MAIAYDTQRNVDALIGGGGCTMYRATSGGTVFTAITSATTAFDYFANNAVVDDAFYIGIANSVGQNVAHNYTFNIGTALVADAITVAYEYDNDSAWTAIPDLIDGTNIFRNTGSQTIYFDQLFRWYSNNRASLPSGNNFWFRIRITAVTNITEGGANVTNKVKVNDGMLQNTNTTTTAFSDLWTADKAGSRQLLCPITATTNLSLYAQPRPMEYGSIRLSCIVTGYSGSGTITLTGTDSADNSITEDISVTADGTYVSTKSYKTISANGVDCTGTYTIEITQPRWGVVGKCGTTAYKLQKVIFVNGDATNNSPFTETAKDIYVEDAAFYNSNASTITFGSISSGEIIYGCNLTFYYTYGNIDRRFGYSYTSHAGGANYFYNSSFYASSTGSRIYPNVIGAVIGCKFTNPYYLYVNSPNVTMSNVAINYTIGTGIYSSAAAMVFSDCTVLNCGGRGLLVSGGNTTAHDGANIIKAYRLNALYNDVDFCLYNAGVGGILIDPVYPPTSSKLGAYQTGVREYRIYLDYTFNLKVIDKSNNPISGVTVLLKDVDGATIVNKTTDANGVITETEVTSKYWSHTWSESSAYKVFSDGDIVTRSPFTLTVSKSGYKTYKTVFTHDAKLNWKIMLAKVLDNNFSDRVSINTK